jgi:prepilin-type N-terminal cleavage/methylation domain-containing protein
MRGGRGFTLVEVLVALGLLVLVAALSLPVAFTNTTGARAQTAERLLRLAPALARGEARELGTPVGLLLSPAEDDGPLRLVVVREPDPQRESAADLAADPNDVATWPQVGEARDLPEGTRLWTGRPEALDDALAENAPPGGGSLVEDALAAQAPGAPAAGGGGSEPPVEPVVLAWFLSDGSALQGDAAGVVLPDGRVVRLRVAALTGAVSLEFQQMERGEEPMGDARADRAAGDRATAQPPAMDAAGMDRAGMDGSQMDGVSPDSAAGADASPFDPPGFDTIEFEPLGFEALEFEALEFEPSPFDGPASGSGSRSGDASDRDGGSGRSSDEPTEAPPQPPQPR